MTLQVIANLVIELHGFTIILVSSAKFGHVLWLFSEPWLYSEWIGAARGMARTFCQRERPIQRGPCPCQVDFISSFIFTKSLIYLRLNHLTWYHSSKFVHLSFMNLSLTWYHSSPFVYPFYSLTRYLSSELYYRNKYFYSLTRYLSSQTSFLLSPVPPRAPGRTWGE